MANISEATCIKKLVKYIYSQEKQIEHMKKMIKNQSILSSSNKQQIDPMIKNQLQCTSYQLKQVNTHLKNMESRMRVLQIDLEEEIMKNSLLEMEIIKEKQKYQRIKLLCEERDQERDRQYQVSTKEIREFQEVKKSQKNLKEQFNKLSEQIDNLKIRQNFRERQTKLLQNQNLQLKNIINRLEHQLKSKETQIKVKQKINDQLNCALQEKNSINVRLEDNNAQLKQSISKFQQKQRQKHKQVQENYLKILKNKEEEFMVILQGKDNDLQSRTDELEMFRQKLKDFQEFSYEISKYIETSYIKHCCSGRMNSSKRLLKDPTDTYKLKFQYTFYLMNSVQQWMEETSEKIKGLNLNDLPNVTLQNISNIVESFQQKLYLCDLTQHMEKEKEEIQKNEQFLLQNLQKQCEKSYQRQRSKIVQLDQMKQILKMTKQVNRQLMDEVNKKQFTLIECRKICKILFGSKSNLQYVNLKKILNI